MKYDIGKWNYVTHQYDPYEVPKDKVLRTYSNDMNEVINCASCFKEIRYGNGYTSRVLHTHFGIGFGVCSECYDNEREEERKYKNG